MSSIASLNCRQATILFILPISVSRCSNIEAECEYEIKWLLGNNRGMYIAPPICIPTLFHLVVYFLLAPTHRPVPLRVVNNHNGTHTVEYTPTEVGNYAIDVAYEGLAIPSSPFSSKAYDAHAIIVSPIPTGIVSKPIEFTGNLIFPLLHT